MRGGKERIEHEGQRERGRSIKEGERRRGRGTAKSRGSGEGEINTQCTDLQRGKCESLKEKEGKGEDGKGRGGL